MAKTRSRTTREDQPGRRREDTPRGNLSLLSAVSPQRKGKFWGAVEEGTLYEDLRDAVDPNLSRDHAKTAVLTVFYGRRHWKSRWTVAFQRLFPDTFEFVQRAKRHSHTKLAHLLQRAESNFIYDQVVARILNERPSMFVATIHDSVVSTVGNEGYIRDLMAAKFERLGIRPRLKVEKFEENQS